ncbi:MAG: peptide antibiotic transporter SbmA [Deltaproteobacteria bacterium]|nr:peptide antibiotic transporter SbmA [Deltaproteobacteria bacterium]
MFSSFFPEPRVLWLAATSWAVAALLVWNLIAYGWGDATGLGRLWPYLYVFLVHAAFVVFWLRYQPHKWARWSVGGGGVIIFATWFQVQLDVMINDWVGVFYNSIQKALAEPGSVSASGYFDLLSRFFIIAGVYIITAMLTNFFTRHYVFRWRTAINDRYVALWPQVRGIEGASQRVQEDAMRFALILESLGSRFIDAVMTLVAFLPILLGLSVHVKEVSLVGEVAHALFWVALGWSAFGTGLLLLAGIRLPGLEFRNQRVEAAFRKELVLGEDDEDRGQPPALTEVFENVRRNYYRLYLNYAYFDVVRYSYLQAGVLVPFVVLGPSILSAGFTWGVLQQILRAFRRVQESFQFLVHSWTTIIELMSIYKRLAAFERAITGDRQAAIEFETAPRTPTG